MSLIGLSDSFISAILYSAANGFLNDCRDPIQNAISDTSIYFSKHKSIEIDLSNLEKIIMGNIAQDEINKFKEGEKFIEGDKLALQFAIFGNFYLKDQSKILEISKEIISYFKESFVKYLLKNPKTSAITISKTQEIFFNTLGSDHNQILKEIINLKILIQDSIKSVNNDIQEQINKTNQLLSENSQKFKYKTSQQNMSLSLELSATQYHFILKNEYPYNEILDDLLSTIEDEEGNIFDSLQKVFIKNEDKKIIQLIGDGGMGKTTNLLFLYKKIISQPNILIPVFIQLYKYSQYYKSNRVSSNFENQNWILNTVAQKYLGQNPPYDTQSLLEVIVQNKVIFLLDGWNEITVDDSKLIANIKDLLEIQNVKFVITSRADLNIHRFSRNFLNLRLKPLPNDTVKAFINKKGIICSNKLVESKLLSNPMILSIYLNMADENIERKVIKIRNSKKRGYHFTNINAKLNVLYNYFLYQKLLADQKYFETIEMAETRFFYDIILHYIALDMSRKGFYELTDDEILRIVNNSINSLKDKEEVLLLSPELIALIEQSPNLTLSKIQTMWKDDVEFIFNLIITRFRIIIRKKDRLSFIHEDFRNYFAGIKLLYLIEKYINYSNYGFINYIKDIVLQDDTLNLDRKYSQLLSKGFFECFNNITDDYFFNKLRLSCPRYTDGWKKLIIEAKRIVVSAKKEEVVKLIYNIMYSVSQINYTEAVWNEC